MEVTGLVVVGRQCSGALMSPFSSVVPVSSDPAFKRHSAHHINM